MTTISTTSTSSVAVDFMNKTITVSRTFLKASRKVGSPAFLTLKQLTEELPSFSIILRAKPTYHKSFQPTYTWMLDYIEMQPNAQEVANEFFKVRSLHHNYNHVRSWFMNKYPHAEKPEVFCETSLMVA